MKVSPFLEIWRKKEVWGGSDNSCFEKKGGITKHFLYFGTEDIFESKAYNYIVKKCWLSIYRCCTHFGFSLLPNFFTECFWGQYPWSLNVFQDDNILRWQYCLHLWWHYAYQYLRYGAEQYCDFIPPSPPAAISEFPSGAASTFWHTDIQFSKCSSLRIYEMDLGVIWIVTICLCSSTLPIQWIYSYFSILILFLIRLKILLHKRLLVNTLPFLAKKFKSDKYTEV